MSQIYTYTTTKSGNPEVEENPQFTLEEEPLDEIHIIKDGKPYLLIEIIDSTQTADNYLPHRRIQVTYNDETQTEKTVGFTITYQEHPKTRGDQGSRKFHTSVPIEDLRIYPKAIPIEEDSQKIYIIIEAENIKSLEHLKQIIINANRVDSIETNQARKANIKMLKDFIIFNQSQSSIKRLWERISASGK